MVYDQVEDDLDVSLVALFNKLLQIGVGAEGTVNVIVICRVVFVIGGACEDGGQPNTLYA